MAAPDTLRSSTREVARSWHLALFTPAEPGRRNRRTVDATLLVAASLGTGIAAVVARMATDVDTDIAQALATVLGWAPNLSRVAFVLGSLLRS
jgi:hypothetical protein